MVKLYNLARMTTPTTSTGTVTLGSAVSGYLSFDDAGVQNGDLVTYGIRDSANSEVGRGTYLSTGTTLSRDTVLTSTNSGNKINLSGNAEVFITAAAEDILSAAVERVAAGAGLGTNYALGATCSGSSSYAGDPVTSAVDGNTSTGWVSNGVPLGWIRVDLGMIRAITQIRIYNANIDGGNYETSIKVDVSEDNLAYTEVRPSGTIALAAWDTTSFAVQNARYVKISEVTKVGYGSIAEIQVYYAGLMVAGLLPNQKVELYDNTDTLQASATCGLTSTVAVIPRGSVENGYLKVYDPHDNTAVKAISPTYNDLDDGDTFTYVPA